MFPTTRRSVIVALGSDDDEQRRRAFDTFVAIYWKPLYKYLRVSHRRNETDAEDLTQAFLAKCFENGSLANYDAAKATFRTFLRVLFDRFVANEHKASQRQKRGGDAIALDFENAEQEIAREHDRGGSPEDYFQREWVRSVFALAVERLRDECAGAGRQTQFAIFEAYDLDETSRASYRETGERFGISESMVTNWLAATRRRFRAIVLDVLREATASDAEYRNEVRALLGVDA
jgi:RNA polymerase sigma factor (sigma-70 family)